MIKYLVGAGWRFLLLCPPSNDLMKSNERVLEKTKILRRKILYDDNGAVKGYISWLMSKEIFGLPCIREFRYSIRGCQSSPCDDGIAVVMRLSRYPMTTFLS